MVAIVLVTVTAAVLGFRLGGEMFATAFDDLGEAVAALIAAAACARTASRSHGQFRRGWAFMAASATAWGIGELAWGIYEVGLHTAVPVPSAADVGFLAAVPLAIVGVMCFWTAPRGLSERFRSWLEGLNIVLSLIFTGWAFGLKEIWFSPGPIVERGIGLAYPVGDILIAAVLILAIRRARRYDHGRMLLLLGGLGANSTADTAFAYMSATGNELGLGTLIGMGWVIGYLMIALAALWPAGPRERVTGSRAFDLWQIALPWMVVLLAAFGALLTVLRGDPYDGFQTVLAIAMAVVLMVLEIMIHIDSLAMLISSRHSEAMLAEVMAEAPIGIARADTRFNIIGANPGLGALLRESSDSLVGVPMARYIPQEAQPLAYERLEALLSGESDKAHGETPFVRADGIRAWARWTAIAVRNSIAHTDYFVITIEDITAQHGAEEAARASLAELQRLNQAKSKFLQSVSRDFKTALIEIEAFSEFMRDTDDLDVKQVREFAGDIYRHADGLDRKVADMLAKELATIDATGGTDVGAIIRNVEALSYGAVAGRAGRARLGSAANT